MSDAKVDPTTYEWVPTKVGPAPKSTAPRERSKRLDADIEYVNTIRHMLEDHGQFEFDEGGVLTYGGEQVPSPFGSERGLMGAFIHAAAAVVGVPVSKKFINALETIVRQIEK